MMGCQAVPAASSTPGPDAQATSTVPAPGAPSSSAGEAPKPGEAGRGGPPFVEVADGPCADLPAVIDAEDVTFLVSKTQARRGQPGRAELEEVAGLPSPRGSSFRFALRPFILAVRGPKPSSTKPDTAGYLGYFLLDPRTHAFSRMETGRFEQPAVFGDYPSALPVPDGTLVITFVHQAKKPTDPGYVVPAGDGSEALMVSRDGLVSPFPSWPSVLFSTAFSTDGVIWAMTTQPGMPGNFVLRVLLTGTPRYFPVPGTLGCRGEARFSYPAVLVEEGAGADEVTVELRESSSCVAKGAAGRYRLSTPEARWRKQPASSAEGPGTPGTTAPDSRQGAGHAEAGPVKVGGATLRIEGTRALITGPGTEGERDTDPDPPGDPAQARSLVVTAGGREVWLQTRWQTHCRLGRYRSW
jgi:hypothetical protein